jgi:glycosyltransferase involved in cell wall biosynthesis
VCAKQGVEEVRHPHSLGNGAAIKSGARAAKGDVLVFLDADFQHDPACIAPLLEGIAAGADMVVGARSGAGHAGLHRRLANAFYNRMASWMSEQRVLDLTSGLRAARRDKFVEFLHLLPNGFSYPTTITMAFLRAGYVVVYQPIETRPRIGKSHISLVRDGSRFLLIIFKIGTLYSPLKLFLPISAGFFLLGLGYYAFTYLTAHRFTNMSALLLSTSVLVFLMGLVSEQITALQYSRRAPS